jgi:predicted HTH domain antitoxin
MSLQTISIELPSDIFLTLNENEVELKKRIKTTLAVELYRQEKVTLGKAAQIAGFSRFAFETLLSEMNISISNLTDEEVLADIKKLN